MVEAGEELSTKQIAEPLDFMLNKDDIRIVAEDLEFLQSWGSDTSDGEIRRGSAVLRRLLVEDVYGHAWRALGMEKQPKLIAVDVAPLTLPAVIGDVAYAIAGGALFRGVYTANMLVNRGSQPLGDFGPPLRPNGYPGEKEFWLSEFMSSPSGVVDGRTFTRRDVIKYIANVRGGVHLGETEKKAEKKLIARLGKIERKLSIHTTDGLLVEIVAIGQALGQSDDARELISSATKI